MKLLRQLKPILLLLIFLAIWTLTPVVVKRFTQDAFYEFQAPMIAVQGYVKDLQTYWSLRTRSKNDLIEAGRDLSRLNSRYQIAQQENLTQEAEIARLESLLELPSRPEFRYEVARVAQRDISAWWHQVIIRKGENYNIPVGAAVIYNGGVVGRVREVHAYTATVELVSSPGFRMAANVVGEAAPVTYIGVVNPPFSPPRGEALNVPPTINVTPTEPRKLVSSELGGIFPAGLTIGEITALEPGSDGYFQKGSVRLSPQLSALREVAIVIPFGQELAIERAEMEESGGI
ncbi:rod shape-determining protein MreC [Cerasicoccus maritimus]|uniref:rod shape-determining protein MreC n=1 Tax=Cerasicoccus maritimus TaxID=490089 RepID=UPI002852C700|nr:rod shape-determining protein MreC [Cerasicoccus maritimus]